MRFFTPWPISLEYATILFLCNTHISKYLKLMGVMLQWTPYLYALPEDGGVEDHEADEEGKCENGHEVSQNPLIRHTEKSK